jgi:hypothetical protein
MLTSSEYLVSTVRGAPRLGFWRLSALATGLTVAVLFLISRSLALGDESCRHSVPDVFEFHSVLHRPVGRAFFSGRMIHAGARRRIVICWIEPTPLREGTHYLRYGDFLFLPPFVHYHIDGLSRSQTMRINEGDVELELPHDGSIESVVRSALTILAYTMRRDERTVLEVGMFFRRSHDSEHCEHEALADDLAGSGVLNQASAEVQVLNTLPYGRVYSKRTRADGTIAWRVERALNGRLLFTVTVRPLEDVDGGDWWGAFDPNTLGQWSLMPEPYRVYWSFDRRYAALGNSKEDRAYSGALCDEIASYPNDETLPEPVARALDRLRFRTALLSQDPNRVLHSMEAFVAGFCADQSVGSYRGLMELGELAAQVKTCHPEQAEQWLRPLVAQMVNRGGEEIPRYVDSLAALIGRNQWFLYGRLLTEEMTRQGAVERDLVARLGTKLETLRLAEQSNWDVELARPSVRRYLERLDAEPGQGPIDMDCVRRILGAGLATDDAEIDERAKRATVEAVIRSLRLIVGGGPFRGDPDTLIESIARFSHVYLRVRRIAEPIDVALATLLALSFCDTSTPEDHEVLVRQFHELAADLRTQVNAILETHELTELIGPEDVQAAFDEQEAVFRVYVADPLWPPFKFPLTAIEKTRIANRVKLRLEQAELLLSEMSAKVKYGGVDDQLKKRTMFEISCVVERLLIDGAFLRRPPYPGVAMQHRGGHGFTAVIQGGGIAKGIGPRRHSRR